MSLAFGRIVALFSSAALVSGGVMSSFLIVLQTFTDITQDWNAWLLVAFNTLASLMIVGGLYSMFLLRRFDRTPLAAIGTLLLAIALLSQGNWFFLTSVLFLPLTAVGAPLLAFSIAPWNWYVRFLRFGLLCLVPAGCLFALIAGFQQWNFYGGYSAITIWGPAAGALLASMLSLIGIWNLVTRAVQLKTRNHNSSRKYNSMQHT